MLLALIIQLGSLLVSYHRGTLTLEELLLLYDLAKEFLRSARVLEEGDAETVEKATKVNGQLDANLRTLVSRNNRDEFVKLAASHLKDPKTAISSTQNAKKNQAKLSKTTNSNQTRMQIGNTKTVYVPRSQDNQMEVTQLSTKQSRNSSSSYNTVNYGKDDHIGSLATMHVPRVLSTSELINSYWLRDMLGPKDTWFWAKYHPGERPVAYVTSEGIQQVSNAVIHANKTDPDNDMDWTCHFFSPVLGSINKGAGYSKQTKTAAQFLTANFGEQTLTDGLTSSGYTELYGSNPDFTETAFVWNQQVTLTLDNPLATSAGHAFVGIVPVSQLGSTTTYNGVKSFFKAIDLRTANHVVGRVSIQNANLINRIQRVGTGVANMMDNLANEHILCIWLQNPSRSITTGTTQSYGTNIEIKANFSYFPNYTSTWGRSLATTPAINDNPKGTIAESQKVTDLSNTAPMNNEPSNSEGLQMALKSSAWSWTPTEVYSYMMSLKKLSRTWTRQPLEADALQQEINSTVVAWQIKFQALLEPPSLSF